MLDKQATASREASSFYSPHANEPFDLPESFINQYKTRFPLADILFDGDDFDLASCHEFYSSEDWRLLIAILPTMSREERALFLRNHSWDRSNA